MVKTVFLYIGLKSMKAEPTPKKVTIEQIMSYGFRERFNCFIKTCSSAQDVWDKCDSGLDLIRLLYKTHPELDKAFWVELVVNSAEFQINMFEIYHAGEDRPRKSINAAKAWLDSPSNENKLLAKNAAETSIDTIHMSYAMDAYNSAAAVGYEDSKDYAYFHALNSLASMSVRLLRHIVKNPYLQ